MKKAYAIWHNQNVIGYCKMDEETADLLNKAGTQFYFGFDKVTNPEKYFNVIKRLLSFTK